MCHGRGGRRRRGFGSPEEWVRRLEAYQRDLEQELADVADVIRRLREGDSEPEQQAQAVSV